MLIIEIHVENIENAASTQAETASPSTRQNREDARPKRANEKIKPAGSRLWKTFKHRAPGYLIQYHKNER